MSGMDDVEGMQETKPSSESEKQPITEDGAPEVTADTMHIPVDFLEGTRFQAGDELVLKVVAVGDDSLEVAYAHAPESEKGEEGPPSAHDEIDKLPAY